MTFKVLVDATPRAEAFAENLVKAAELFAGVSLESVKNFGSAPSEEPKNDKPAQDKEPTEAFADKTQYWKHEGSDDIIKIEKGESLSILGGDIFDPATKADFDKQEKAAAANEAAQKKAQEEKAATEKVEAKTEEAQKTYVLEDVRAQLKALMDAGKQDSASEILNKYGAAKLSVLDKASYGDVINDIKELLGTA